MSTVNVAEVSACLFQEGWDEEEVESVFAQLGVSVIPFDEAAAISSGSLRMASRQFGLGLGDRAFLAVAIDRKCPALTADRAWAQLGLPGLEIRCIR